MTAQYRLKFFNDAGYAGLEADDGMDLMIPVAWLPDDISKGSKLIVTLTPEASAITVRIEKPEAPPNADENS